MNSLLNDTVQEDQFLILKLVIGVLALILTYS